MRVLMIAGVTGKAEAGGAGVVHNVARELRNLGHTVKPMFFEDLLPKQRWPARFRTVEFAARVSRYVAEIRNEYDVVNIYAPYGFWYGFHRRRKGSAAGPPYVMSMHGLEERRNYAMARESKKDRAHYFRLKNRIWQHFYHMRTYRWSIESANQCIVTNREALLFLQMQYGLAPDRVWFIPNGVGQEFFQRRVWSETLEPKLLFVGTWIDHKGIYALAETFEQLLVLAPRVQLTIAGCAETEERVRRYFSPTAQRSINVRPFISRAEMPEVYAQHDIFVLPSLVEGMPLVLLEAMASGLAVVTTESSGMTDLVEDGHDGLLTIPGDADSLTIAISSLCGNSQLRHKLGCAAQEKMKRFTWKLSAVRHEAVFRRAMGVKPVPMVPEPEETNIGGGSYSGKVILN
ncbi:MAG TPA: glycosyltransferase family 4 protein [Methylomirabilota bacterium]|nr:glycosyltransferase family 4 protein [Methylomirabilota bacterium]